MRRDAAAAGGEAPAGVERTWLLATAVPVAVVLGVALAAALAMGDETVRRALTDAVRLGAALLWGLLYWPLLAAGFLVELLFAAVEPLVPLRVTLPRLLPDLPAPGDWLPPPATGAGGPAPWPGAFRWALAGVVLAGVAAAFLLTALAVRRRGAAPAPRRRRAGVALVLGGPAPRLAPLAGRSAVLAPGPARGRRRARDQLGRTRRRVPGRSTGAFWPSAGPAACPARAGRPPGSTWAPGAASSPAKRGGSPHRRLRARPVRPAGRARTARPAELQQRLDRLRRLVARRPAAAVDRPAASDRPAG